MKKTTHLVLTALAMVAADVTRAEEKPAVAGERYVLLRLVDMVGNDTLDVKPLSEFRKLQAQIKREAALFPRALSLAEKEWTKNKSKDEKGSFPRSLVKPREVKEIGTFATQEEAQKKLTVLTEREAPSERDIQRMRQRRTNDREKEAKKAEREAERKAKAELIATMVETHLTELMTAAAAEEKKPAEAGGD